MTEGSKPQFRIIIPKGRERDVAFLAKWVREKGTTTPLQELAKLSVVKDQLKEWGCTYEEIT